MLYFLNAYKVDCDTKYLCIPYFSNNFSFYTFHFSFATIDVNHSTFVSECSAIACPIPAFELEMDTFFSYKSIIFCFKIYPAKMRRSNTIDEGMNAQKSVTEITLII